jgi:hypothetical protein
VRELEGLSHTLGHLKGVDLKHLVFFSLWRYDLLTCSLRGFAVSLLEEVDRLEESPIWSSRSC